jgi:perosamine synthetase
MARGRLRSRRLLPNTSAHPTQSSAHHAPRRCTSSISCLASGRATKLSFLAQTHVATAHAVELTGAKPIFVDAELRTGNIDIAAIEARITPRTRAIAVVHYLGVPVDMVPVNAIAKRHRLFVLEDCALAIGTRFDGIHAGLLGDAGCFSFYPVKHMTTAEGGMIITRDGAFAEKLRHIRAFGVDRHSGERKIPGVYDVTALGFNYRMNEIESAIGIEQVKAPGRFFLSSQRGNPATATTASAFSSSARSPRPASTLSVR